MNGRIKSSLRALSVSALLCASVPALASDPLIVPEAASGFSERKAARYASAMAVTANPHASNAALQMLQRGGSAVDAAIAAQLVLGLVEPQSSGIGGGAFMLHWSARDKALTAWDGRETAPAGIGENHFLTEEGKPMNFFDAVVGGHAVGVPGVIAMLETSHRKYGKLDWATLFKPAIALAEEGFAISERLYALLSRMPRLAVNPEIRQYFFIEAEDGLQPKPEGTILTNPAYANTLRRIAKGGSEEFYRGELAKQIVTAVANDPNRSGALSLADMSSYRAQQLTPICAPFMTYSVCGAPPPSSGGTTVLAILGMLDAYTREHGTRLWQHAFIEASKLAFADRNTYIGDPAFVDVPVKGLVDRGYLAQKARQISGNRAIRDPNPGIPPGAAERQPSRSLELPSTTHLSIVDASGNAVSLTSSIETAFGSRIMVGGFLLNNQLTDFSFAPRDERGVAIANRVEGGKRPRSSMAPTIVMEGSRPVLITGSPGGARIIDYVALNIYRVLAENTPVADAIADGNIVAMGNTVELEINRFDDELKPRLEKRGHRIDLRDQTSGLHAIRIRPEGLEGGADPRREGAIRGY